MPNYEFQNLKTGEIETFHFSLKDCPKIGSELEIEGKKYKRVITSAPYGSVDGKGTDPFNAQKFVEKTKTEGKETIGGVMDRAKELSQKRAQKAGGKDPIQQKWFKEYSKKRQGKKHPLDRN